MNDLIISVVAFIVLLLLVFSKPIYYWAVRNSSYGRIKNTFKNLINSDGYQQIEDNNPIKAQLEREIRKFDDPILTNIDIDIMLLAHKKVNGVDVYLNYYEWEKSRTHMVETRHGKRRVKQIELRLKSGVYIPIPTGAPRMLVRGRLGTSQEEKMELEQGRPTPPIKGVPQFDVLFVCKGPNPMAVSSLITMEAQKDILSFNGVYPVIDEALKHLVIYIHENGMNITMDKAPDAEQMKALVEFSIMLYNSFKKTGETGAGPEDLGKAGGEEEVYKADI